MHTFLSAFMGFFMGITSFFHGGGGAMPAHNPPSQQANMPRTASSSGMFRHRNGRGMMMKLPAGERAFFGNVTAVNGSTLTVQRQIMRFRPYGNGNAPSPAVSPMPQTITVTINSSTKISGGSQSNISTSSRIAGIGTVQSDGSITAIQLRINPTMPSGFPRRFRNNFNPPTPAQ
jgi:hypothetical protein